jgi:hypothetical protein
LDPTQKSNPGPPASKPSVILTLQRKLTYPLGKCNLLLPVFHFTRGGEEGGGEEEEEGEEGGGGGGEKKTSESK